MHDPRHDEKIADFRRYVGVYLFAGYFLMLATIWMFVWATVVLVVRAWPSLPAVHLVWGAAGIPVVAIIAVVLAVRRLPPRLAVRAVLDQESQCGGLLMAAHEQDIGEWKGSMPSLSTPRIRWRGGRPFGLFLVSMAFLAVAFLFPQRLVALVNHRSLEVDEEIARLNRQIETLKEEKIIDPVRAEALEKKLAQVEEEAEGQDPVKTWEALDHVMNMTAKAAKEAAEEALRETEQLTKAEKLAEALKQAGEKMKPDALNEAMAELAEMAQKAAEENKELMDKNMSEALQNACKEGNLNAEQLKELADALRGGKKDLKEKLEKLREQGLIDLKTMKMCEKIGKCDCEGLAQFLAENEGEMSLEEMLDQDGKPGRGGVSRGRGDAEMTWTDGSSEEGVKFKEKTLPPSSLEAIKDSTLSGVSKGKPQTNTREAASKAGALNNSKAGGGAANTQVILPRHRGTVERYFERR